MSSDPKPPAEAPEPGSPSTPTPEPLWVIAVIILALGLLTLGAYAPALNAGFLYDDPGFVLAAPVVSADGAWHDIWLDSSSTPRYAPLVFTSFRIEYRLWPGSVSVHHLVNILLHAAAAALLWRVLQRLAVPGALPAAAVFALHPVHVESVAWLVQRANVLSAFFAWAAVLAYLHFAHLGTGALDRPPRRSATWYGLALACFVFAMSSNPVTCTLPVALLLVLWWKRDRLSRRDLGPLVPFFIIAVTLVVVAVVAQKTHARPADPDLDLSWAGSCIAAGRAVWLCAARVICPVNLAFIYPAWRIDPGVWYLWFAPASILAVLAAVARWRDWLGKGGCAAVFIFVVTLVPGLGLLDWGDIRYSPVTDHDLYHASASLIALLAAGVTLAVARWRTVPSGAPLAGAALLLWVLGTITWFHAHHYEDAETLWRATLARNPQAWPAQVGLGDLLLARGQSGPAADHYRQVLAHRPETGRVRTKLSIALMHQERTDEAVTELRIALEHDPDAYLAHLRLGDFLLARGQSRTAADHFRLVLAVRPDHPRARTKLGVALLHQDRPAEALAELQIALQHDPDDPLTHGTLGITLARHDRPDESLEHLRRAAELAGTDPVAHKNLAVALESRGHVAEAIDHYGRALEGLPRDAGVTGRLAWLLATRSEDDLRDGPRAELLATMACRLTQWKDPDHIATLAAAQAERGRFGQALTTANQALRLAQGDRNSGLLEEIRQAIARYRRQKPFRQPAETAPAP